ncbi:multiple inositol polyphosphate phosphatase 1 isoform X2 [Parasteatoda tepidariorum]|uniref:multiple inositol polyphosphate phosphatase 1 isoform X2 n=1 Tax=Parasteatoda tepidariorum TaxID=114398 RepID=UPI0039BD7BAF
MFRMVYITVRTQGFFVVLVYLLGRHFSESDPNPPDTCGNKTCVNLDGNKTCVNLDGKKTCYAADPTPYRNYGTKASYPAVYEDYTTSYDLEGCVPKVFYLLSRHATRYPDKEYILYINEHLPSLKEKIIAAYEKGEAKLCEDDVNKLRAWSPTMTKGDQNQLSATGAAEAEELGERLRKRFPQILGMNYSPEVFEIAYTTRSRTQDTAENFTRGLITEKDYEKINFNGKANDTLLQFHKDCKKIMKKCDNPQFDVKEVEEYVNGTLMQKALDSISKRIGFSVSSEDITHMYVACTFGHALNISDAWCSLFSNDDIKVMEYADDIEDYYKRSYGNDVNYEQACPLIKYIIDLFRSYEKTKKNKVALHFSHAGALTRIFAALGMFKDERKLTAEDFCALNNRKWRTSNVVPFNTNLAFVLYDCKGKLKFLTMHNEKPIAIAGCEVNKLCSLETFYDEYNSKATDCDLKKICHICKTK